eukprot:c9618_g1_i2.p1 GENE.c9618_g1_i2~~c9618_g1_i2.p1  ORF type:complete len:900 (+),score=304.30 c9618_g1_i2:2-2701(+)
MGAATPLEQSVAMQTPRQADNVKVVCRFRPQNAREIDEGGHLAVEIDPLRGQSGQTLRLVGSEQHAFTFDQVFDWNTTQAQVYEGAAKDIVESVLDGYNGTVFAYGQTGSGKTFTMEGPSIDDPNTKGIIPRMVSHVFELMSHASSTIEFTVKVSMIEIYLERIRDLLDSSKTNLEVHEDKIRGVYVEDATEEYVSSPEDVFMVMKYGASLRATASTKMNEQSSRSHSIFIMEIKQRDIKTESVRTGKLFLVDLAGSEKVRKTNASGDRLEEAKNINKSLAALGNVINALTDGNVSHVPYRDSKLSRILQNSLGGNSKTCLVLAASPSSWNEQETLSTCRFGARAKMIKNRAVVNQEFTAAQLKLLLANAEAEIERLRMQLASGGQNPDATLQTEDDRWNMQQLHDALMDELREKTEETRNLKDEVAALQRDTTRLKQSHERESSQSKSLIEELKRKLFEAQQTIVEKEDEIKRLKDDLIDKEQVIELLGAPPNVIEEDQNQEAKIAELEALLEMQQTELRAIQKAKGDTQRNPLAEILESKEVELTKLKARVKDLETRYTQATENIRKYKESEKRFQGMVQQLHQAHAQLQVNFTKSMEEQLQRHVEAYQASVAQRTSLEEENRGLLSEVEELRRNLGDLKESYSKLTKDFKERCDKVVELKMELDCEKDQNETLMGKGGVKNPKQMKETIDFMQRSLQQYSQVSQQLLIENQQVTQRTTDLERQIAEQNDLYRSLSRRFEKLRDVVVSQPVLKEAVMGRGLTDDDLADIESIESEGESGTPRSNSGGVNRVQEQIPIVLPPINLPQSSPVAPTQPLQSSFSFLRAALSPRTPSPTPTTTAPPTQFPQPSTATTTEEYPSSLAEASKPRIVRPIKGGDKRPSVEEAFHPKPTSYKPKQ